MVIFDTSRYLSTRGTFVGWFPKEAKGGGHLDVDRFYRILALVTMFWLEPHHNNFTLKNV